VFTFVCFYSVLEYKEKETNPGKVLMTSSSQAADQERVQQIILVLLSFSYSIDID